MEMDASGDNSFQCTLVVGLDCLLYLHYIVPLKAHITVIREIFCSVFPYMFVSHTLYIV